MTPFVPRPAPLQRRALAGGFDAAFIVVLSGITFAVPLAVRGLVLPMWGVLAVLLGYAVVPVAFFKRTLGMQVFGLEVVGRQGHALDLANELFRELLMRGWFPAAYLFTIVAGLVASFFHLGGTAAPPVLAGLMTVLSSGLFAVALIGHVIALGRPDQRTLADLVSGSFVVAGPALPPPADLDEFDEWKAHRRRVLRNVVVFEAVLALGVFALPWALTSAGGETPSQRAQRLKLEALEAKFAASPGSESLTADLQHELRLAGREADVRAVFEQHRQALSVKEANRELQLREQLAQTHERETAEALIALLEQQDRVDDAREVYLEWLGDAPAPSALAGFGHWLATNGKTEEAVEVLTRATTLDPLVPFGQTLLGVSLQRAGRLTVAREHLALALLDDPSDEDAADALREVEAKVGVLAADGKQALRARFERWRREAGR